MKDKKIFITGANGEIGNLLLPAIRQSEPEKLITLDLNPLISGLEVFTDQHFTGSISDELLISKIFEEKIDIVIHLAAKLSTSSENNPKDAFDTNVIGVNNLFSHAAKQGDILLLFPSSIAVYGIPNLDIKQNTVISEYQYTEPITLYGVHKLFAENLGNYYKMKGQMDFRSIRFPGLLSAETIPSGGTSDFGPEIVHYYAQKKDYACYVSVDSYLPFMAMPDAVDAILKLVVTPRENVKHSVYNIASFSASPKEIIQICEKNFPSIKITYEIDEMRQKIVDSWPKQIDDTIARDDWGWNPKYDFATSFENYLIPKIH